MPRHNPPHFFLIDGYALIYRAFFALISRPLRTSKGENTSAAWGVVNFLLLTKTTTRVSPRGLPCHCCWNSAPSEPPGRNSNR